MKTFLSFRATLLLSAAAITAIVWWLMPDANESSANSAAAQKAAAPVASHVHDSDCVACEHPSRKAVREAVAAAPADGFASAFDTITDDQWWDGVSKPNPGVLSREALLAKKGDTVEINLGAQAKWQGTLLSRATRPDGTQIYGIKLGETGFVLRYHEFSDGSVLGKVSKRFHPVSYRLAGDKENLTLTRISVGEDYCAEWSTEKNTVVEGIPRQDGGPPTGGRIRIPSLISSSTAPNVIYLDFNGELVSGTSWNDLFNEGNDIDAQDSDFNEAQIQSIWEIIAEDFRPFNVNVTTERAIYEATPVGNRMMVIFTPTDTAAPGAGGVAFLGSFYDGTDDPCWVFNSGVNAAAIAGSHEVGHTLDLLHDGRNNPFEEYYPGTPTWGAIMGAPYDSSMTQWSQGEYIRANNQEDDIAIMASHVSLVTDEDANTLDSARPLTTDEEGNVSASGIITSQIDTDYFAFEVNNGNINLTIQPLASTGAGNLNVLARILDESGGLISESNPNDSLNANLAEGLGIGKFYLAISGGAEGTWSSGGYGSYGSIGAYSVTGTLPIPSPGDTDNDSLTDAEELALGTDPYDADTDNDGITDRDEVYPFSIQSESKGFNEALADAFSKGGIIATIETREKLYRVKRGLFSKPFPSESLPNNYDPDVELGQRLWIGGHDTSVDGRFRWLNAQGFNSQAALLGGQEIGSAFFGQLVPGNSTITNIVNIAAVTAGRPIIGPGISANTTITVVNTTTRTATLSKPVAASFTSSVGQIVVNNPGFSYETAPAISFNPPGAQAVAQISEGRLTAIVITDGGSYATPPEVIVTGGNGGGATASAVLTQVGSARVQTIAITNGGSGYTSVPTVVITGGGAPVETSATAVATVSGARVTGIAVINPGSGYTSIPTVTLVGGGGTSATAVANIQVAAARLYAPASPATYSNWAALLPGNRQNVPEAVFLNAGTAFNWGTAQTSSSYGYLLERPATNPLSADTDGDGIPDNEENTIYGTNPTLADTDGDGFNDATEIAANPPSDPRDSTSIPEATPPPAETFPHSVPALVSNPQTIEIDSSFAPFGNRPNTDKTSEDGSVAIRDENGVIIWASKDGRATRIPNSSLAKTLYVSNTECVVWQNRFDATIGQRYNERGSNSQIVIHRRNSSGVLVSSEPITVNGTVLETSPVSPATFGFTLVAAEAFEDGEESRQRYLASVSAEGVPQYQIRDVDVWDRAVYSIYRITWDAQVQYLGDTTQRVIKSNGNLADAKVLANGSDGSFFFTATLARDFYDDVEDDDPGAFKSQPGGFWLSATQNRESIARVSDWSSPSISVAYVTNSRLLLETDQIELTTGASTGLAQLRDLRRQTNGSLFLAATYDLDNGDNVLPVAGYTRSGMPPWVYTINAANTDIKLYRAEAGLVRIGGTVKLPSSIIRGNPYVREPRDASLLIRTEGSGVVWLPSTSNALTGAVTGLGQPRVLPNSSQGLPLYVSATEAVAWLNADAPVGGGGIVPFAQIRHFKFNESGALADTVLAPAPPDFRIAGRYVALTPSLSPAADPDSEGWYITTFEKSLISARTTTMRTYRLVSNSPDQDLDGDGLTNAQENALGTNPVRADTDLDGLTDFQEARTYFTNPLLADTDGDGLSDGDEIITYKTDPFKRDTDGDGFTDFEEVTAIPPSDPLDPASKPNVLDEKMLKYARLLGEQSVSITQPYTPFGNRLEFNRFGDDGSSCVLDANGVLTWISKDGKVRLLPGTSQAIPLFVTNTECLVWNNRFVDFETYDERPNADIRLFRASTNSSGVEQVTSQAVNVLGKEVVETPPVTTTTGTLSFVTVTRKDNGDETLVPIASGFTTADRNDDCDVRVYRLAFDGNVQFVRSQPMYIQNVANFDTNVSGPDASGIGYGSDGSVLVLIKDVDETPTTIGGDEYQDQALWFDSQGRVIKIGGRETRLDGGTVTSVRRSLLTTNTRLVFEDDNGRVYELRRNSSTGALVNVTPRELTGIAGRVIDISNYSIMGDRKFFYTWDDASSLLRVYQMAAVPVQKWQVLLTASITEAAVAGVVNSTDGAALIYDEDTDGIVWIHGGETGSGGFTKLGNFLSRPLFVTDNQAVIWENAMAPLRPDGSIQPAVVKHASRQGNFAADYVQIELDGTTLLNTPRFTPVPEYWRLTTAQKTSGDTTVLRTYQLVDQKDSDQDGIPDEEELLIGTDPNNPDTDGDGLTDGEEVNPTAPRVATNPLLADTDGDGLSDGQEVNPTAPRVATNPMLADTDGDGLSDLVETNTRIFVSASNTGTNPTIADTDDDGLTDYQELNPTAPRLATNPNRADSDSDGLSDLVETNTGIFVSESNTGTNPLLVDTDGDGSSDFDEVYGAPPTNPNDPASKPPLGRQALLHSYPQLAGPAQTIRVNQNFAPFGQRPQTDKAGDDGSTALRDANGVIIWISSEGQATTLPGTSQAKTLYVSNSECVVYNNRFALDYNVTDSSSQIIIYRRQSNGTVQASPVITVEGTLLDTAPITPTSYGYTIVSGVRFNTGVDSKRTVQSGTNPQGQPIYTTEDIDQWDNINYNMYRITADGGLQTLDFETTYVPKSNTNLGASQVLASGDDGSLVITNTVAYDRAISANPADRLPTRFRAGSANVWVTWQPNAETIRQFPPNLSGFINEVGYVSNTRLIVENPDDFRELLDYRMRPDGLVSLSGAATLGDDEQLLSVTATSRSGTPPFIYTVDSTTGTQLSLYRYDTSLTRLGAPVNLPEPVFATGGYVRNPRDGSLLIEAEGGAGILWIPSRLDAATSQVRALRAPISLPASTLGMPMHVSSIEAVAWMNADAPAVGGVVPVASLSHFAVGSDGTLVNTPLTPPIEGRHVAAPFQLSQDPDSEGWFITTFEKTSALEAKVRTYRLLTQDTDGDGLTDADEINQYGTDPNNPDTDGDGVSDGDEVRNGTDPNVADAFVGIPTVTPGDNGSGSSFVPFSDARVATTYEGLIFDPVQGHVFHQKLSVSKRGGFSSSIRGMTPSLKSSFKGTFNPAGYYLGAAPKGLPNIVSIELQMFMEAPGQWIVRGRAQKTTGGWLGIELRPAKYGKSMAYPLPGRLTMALPNRNAGLAGPRGEGAVVGSISKTGGVSLQMYLPDGGRASYSGPILTGPVASDDLLTIYGLFSSRNRSSALLGPVDMAANNVNNDFEGYARFYSAASANGGQFTGGFDQLRTINGSRYVQPPRGFFPVSSISAGAFNTLFNMEGGDFGGISKVATWNVTNKIVIPASPTDSGRVRFAPATGLVTFSYTRTDAERMMLKAVASGFAVTHQKTATIPGFYTSAFSNGELNVTPNDGTIPELTLISPMRRTVDKSGAIYEVQVQTPGDWELVVPTDATWISAEIISGGVTSTTPDTDLSTDDGTDEDTGTMRGNGNGVVRITVNANITYREREVSVEIAGINHRITQSGF